jgi:hypothetical protein
MILLFLALPAALLAGWTATWFLRRPLRWLWFFGAGFGVMLLVVAGFYLQPQHPCRASGLACVDDYSFFAVGNLLSGFGTWLGLLVLTGLVEAGRAIVSGMRPGEGGNDGGGAAETAEQAVVGGTGATEPHPIELPDRRDPGRGVA